MEENAIAKAILKKRTAQLARSKQETQGLQKEGVELVVFALGNESYGIEARALKSILTPKDIIPLPGVAPFIKGITNLSGVLYSVFDLKEFLGLQESAPSETPSLLVVDDEVLKVCFLADRIIAFQTINIENLDTNVSGIKGLKTGLIKGITNDTLIVLNMEKILTKIAEESKVSH